MVNTMTVVDVLKSAQFVVDNKGQQTAVLLDIESWQALVDWIEDLVDVKIASEALSELKSAGGHPQQAGWLAWEEISEEWSGEEEIGTEDIAV